MQIGNFVSLALRKEIKGAHKNGKTLKTDGLALKYLYAPGDANKIAFIVRKKLGNSPARNKFKRQVREIVAHYQTNTPIHVLIIAKPEAFGYPFDRLKNEIEQAFSKLQRCVDAKNSSHVISCDSNV